MVRVPSSCRLDRSDELCDLPTAVTAAAVQLCGPDSGSQRQSAAVAAVTRASGTVDGSDRRGSTCIRTSFAAWADSSAPANGDVMLAAAGSGSFATAGISRAAPRSPRAPVVDVHGSTYPRGIRPDSEGTHLSRSCSTYQQGSGENMDTGDMLNPRAWPVSEGADLGPRGAVYRRASVEDMFARGSVIQPSPKLLGLMEIYGQGSTAG